MRLSADRPAGQNMFRTVLRQPMFRYLMVLTICSTVGLQTWRTLFNNFAADMVGLEGSHIGMIQSVREVPGFLALLVVYVLLVIREHRLSALSVLVFLVPFPVIQQYRLIIIGVLVAIAVALVIATRMKQREAFGWALTMVGSAVVAVALRTLDLNVCDVIPVGTHFFWHIFLGFAAYAGVRLIVRLQPEHNAEAGQPA